VSEPWEQPWDNEEEEETAPRPVRRRRSRRNEQRGNLYLLTGLVIGLVLGLAYAWLISPVKYIDTNPKSLAEPYKDGYRQLIALAYAADHNLGRARERLSLLESGGDVQVLASQAQRMLAENQPPQEARALAVLAADLGKPQGAATPTGEKPSPQAVSAGATETPGEPTAVETTPATEVSSAIQTPTQPLPTRTPTITFTPMPTFTPRPTATPLPVLDAPFKLASKKEVCDGSVAPGLLQVIVAGENSKPLPGVKITIKWKGGEETFYTGLAPEIGLGYADFLMETGVEYSLQVGDVSDSPGILRARENCALRVEFGQQE
jgi:hypothetical protein